MYNTIIIGAGAVGSYLAVKLAQLGYEVLVLDKKAAAGEDVCCTGIISKKCLDLLSIDSKLIIRQAKSARFISPSGKPLRLRRGDEVAYIIDRPALDKTLAERAQASGVQYDFSTEVVNIQAGTDLRCLVVDCKERKKFFEAQTVVIAAGFGSLLPKRLDLGEINDFIIGAQAEVNTYDAGEVEIYFDQKLAPDGFAWLVPTRDNKGLAGLLTRQQPERHLKKLLSNLKAQGKIDSTEAIPCYGAIPLQPLPKTYTDRVLVVGEAAGQVKPATGGGIYYGILCADIAADILHQAYQARDFSESRLASYEDRWRARLSKELQVGYWARRLYKKLDNRQIERLHNFVSNNGISQFIAELDDLSFDWHSELIPKILRHLVVTIPAQTISPIIKHSTINSLNLQ